MKLTKAVVTFYMSGLAVTFVWVFFVLSGVPSCAADDGPCQAILGVSGKFALIWPAYWIAKFAGGQYGGASLPIEPLIPAMAVLGLILVALRIRSWRREGAKAAPKFERLSPPAGTDEPNRRDQSADPSSRNF